MRQNMTEKELVLNYISSANKPVSISDIKTATDFQVDNRTVQRWLNSAAKQGLILITGERKARKYVSVPVKSKPTFKFLEGLPSSKQQELLSMLRTIWTHNSTALEGNTLNLGETQFILNEGLTVSGKPLKDHKEVMGHATAIDLLYDMISSELTVSKIKQLHKAVQTDIIFDIDKPYGDFKVVPNGTYLLLDDNSKVYHAYSRPFDVPKLIIALVEYIKSCKPQSIDEAITLYATTHIIFGQIHPFWDGNGRIARLIANLILLRAGFAPLVIPATRRLDYITIISKYSAKHVAPSAGEPLFHDGNELKAFINFCKECYQDTINLIENIK
jgi:Fic family protein